MNYCTYCGVPHEPGLLREAPERKHADNCKEPRVVAARALLEALRRIRTTTGMSLYNAQSVISEIIGAQNKPTLRDQFAMAALSGVHPVNEADAAHAYKVADMMLAAREPPNPDRNTK